MGWGREYAAIITGSADAETKARFLRAYRDGDPELHTLLAARAERAVAIERLLSGELSVPEASLDEERTDAGDGFSDADA